MISGEELDFIFVYNVPNAAGNDFIYGLEYGGYHTFSKARTASVTLYLYDSGVVSLTAASAKIGDLDGDNAVTVNDVLYLVRHLNGYANYPVNPLTADIDGNGKVDIFDALYLARHLNSHPGYETLGPKT